MPKKKYRITYEDAGTIFQKDSEVVEAKNGKEALKLGEDRAFDHEFVEEYLQPINMIKVKKVEEVI